MFCVSVPYDRLVAASSTVSVTMLLDVVNRSFVVRHRLQYYTELPTFEVLIRREKID